MATWRTPKTNWQSIDKLLKGDINRIEENLLYLAEREPAVRQMLANAITAMGRSASASETYQQLAEKIRQISNDANAQPEDVLEGKTFYSGGTKKTGIWPGPMFGTGELGHFNSTSGTPVSCDTGDLVVLDYKSFTLNAGHGIYTTNPVRALVIRSWGDIIIDGVIGLDSRGGFGDRYITIGGEQYDLLGGFGGNGGDGGRAWAGMDDRNSEGGKEDCGQRAAGGLRGGGGGGGGPYGGNGGAKNATGEQFGRGGKGGYREDAWGYAPGSVGKFGSGGGGGSHSEDGVGSIYAGRGADATNEPRISGFAINGGGAGGGGGGISTDDMESWNTAYAGDGAEGQLGGGALVLIAGGNVVINGAINARGGDGGRGGNAYRGSFSRYMAGAGGGGGGSGGGRVIILYRGNYTNNGVIDLSGGPGGAPGIPYWEDDDYTELVFGQYGSPGQPGSVQVKQLL